MFAQHEHFYGGTKSYELQLAPHVCPGDGSAFYVSPDMPARVREPPSGTASDGGTARLIVYRIPTMGKFVIVQVYVDDVVVGSMGYGGTV
jgi:hypothetical protein